MVNNHPARYDTRHGALIIEGLHITQEVVVAEARHWSTGQRAEAVETSHLAEADLSSFVQQALAIGAGALSSAGGTQQAFGVEKLVAEAEKRSKQAAEDAARDTKTAVEEASTALSQTAELTAKQVRTAVESAHQSLTAEVARLFGGADPALAKSLHPVLLNVTATIKEQTIKETNALLDRVARDFNPANPTSPMAVQMSALTAAQERQTASLLDAQKDLATKVDGLVASVQSKTAHDKVVAATALKGASYEDAVHAILSSIAAGLGDEYIETGKVTGFKTRSKKGDGVLGVIGSEARVVVEMTDSTRPHWSAYLAEAEENRGAQASLGLARTTEQLGGEAMLTIGPRRLVLVFDPERDDPALLRCALQMVRLSAVAACSSQQSGELTSADEALTSALDALAHLAKIRSSAQGIRKQADSIESNSNTLETELNLLIAKAQTCIRGAGATELKAA